jgi:tetraacyldisaccharide 4'-kinase
LSPGILAPLTPLYRAAVTAKNAGYDRGWITPKRLRWPVVSVGNLSVGGAGKTPLVIRLAQLLAERGLAVDVLSRGYGRSSREVERVDAEGDASRFGDEPLLIARAAGVPVYVGASRYAAGLLAERETGGKGVHLLDDGFQHRQLARDADIVVVHASDFAERLLLAGRLREPLSALRRTSVIVLRSEDAALEREVRELGVEAPVWWQHRRLTVKARERAIAFCGIARPEEFFAGLRALGLELAGARAFRDHHRYDDTDMEDLLRMRRETGAGVCVTTEKDLVRLSAEQRGRLAAEMDLEAARLMVELADEAAAVEQLLGLLGKR